MLFKNKRYRAYFKVIESKNKKDSMIFGLAIKKYI